MASAFEAFQPSVVVDEFARKIESLCVWEDTLVSGLSDGSLLFFNEQSSEEQGSRVVSTWQVTRVQKSFGKRSILQLQALEDQPYLLSLSGMLEIARMQQQQAVPEAAAAHAARHAVAHVGQCCTSISYHMLYNDCA